MGTTNATWCCFILAVSCCILLLSTADTLLSAAGVAGEDLGIGDGVDDGDGRKTANHLRRLFSMMCWMRLIGTTWLLSQMITLGQSRSTFCSRDIVMQCEEIFSCFIFPRHTSVPRHICFGTASPLFPSLRTTSVGTCGIPATPCELCRWLSVRGGRCGGSGTCSGRMCGLLRLRGGRCGGRGGGGGGSSSSSCQMLRADEVHIANECLLMSLILS